MVKGFKEFVLRGNVADLAVAVVIGVAFGAVVTALVEDLITPLIAAIGGKPDFSGLTFTVNKSQFFYGKFVNAIVSFAVVAAAIYFLVILPMTRFLERRARPAAEVATRDCPECLSTIPVAARRCSFCTATVGAGPTTGGA